MLNASLILLGIALLLAGRHLLWLFVGTVGFILGVQFIGPLVDGSSWTAILIGGLVGGILGALLAIIAQSVAVVFSGFIVGGEIVSSFINTFIPLSLKAHFFFFFTGGAVCAAFLIIFFEEAIMVLTSLWGASIIANHLSLSHASHLPTFVILSVFGIIFQAALARRHLAH